MAPTYLSPGVYVEEVDKGSKPIEAAGTAVAAFIGFAEKGEVNTAKLVTNWTQFVNEFGGFIPGSYLAHSVYGYFSNGGGRAYVMRLGPEDDGAAGELEAPKATAALPAGSSGDALRVTVKDDVEPSGIEVEILDATPSGDEAPAEDAFTLVVRGGGAEERFENVRMSPRPAGEHVATAVNESDSASKMIQVEVLKTSGPMVERKPATGTYALEVSLPEIKVEPKDFEGDAAERKGIGGLEVLDDVTMVLAPDLMTAFEQGIIDDEGLRGVQTALINHCERMGDRVAILDAPPAVDSATGTSRMMKPQEMENWITNVARYDSSYAAFYYPWLRIVDPVTGRGINVPPSGHMAGIWARNDDTRGVHKAPANEVVGGAIDVAYQISKAEQDGLNPKGVNCIRAFPGRGIRVWGARTLSSDASWRYINVRRLFNQVEKSIEMGTQWVVFEPNDFALWQRIKRDITSFLNMFWRSGALFGQTPGEAFYVKCDEETNPPEARDLGQVVVEIGIAPVKPAEFVIFRISQYSPDAG